MLLRRHACPVIVALSHFGAAADAAFGATVMNLTLKSDFLFLLALRLARRAITRIILHTPPELVAQADHAPSARSR